MELTSNGRARGHVAVQEFDETLDRREHAEEIGIWLPSVGVRLRILRGAVLRYKLP